ncbi:MAG: ribosome small subunit-dependent GTPase A [Thiofilum sp.]|uniref:ribosome small subunit-dependent GTPase A n=1 Tax=Thiofilum sp. TaxID=2212733 RepID=UPI0025FD3781|nr:ribosome small subunit-dependent GTPase A [Thiofilum sp.]MBK8452212.1 ribosome small subunit-dependent GTPase A [Thiofilum sp.]
MNDLVTARVITRFGADVLITHANQTIRCTPKRKLEHIACGDYVTWEENAQGNATITTILPRTNVLTRPDFRGKPKNIATNIDLVIIVVSWRPSPSWEMLDRYLVATELLPAQALIVMNKADLADEYASADDLKCLAEYEHIGYSILYTQAKEGSGIAALRAAIGAKTAIVVGQSGVGKSSLAAQLLPEQEIRVGEIADTGEGRHTTTNAMLYALPEHGFLIDSPGVRDFSLSAVTREQLQQGYSEFRPYQFQCRFNNCTHAHEPHCAIKQAVAAQQLPPHRYERYLNLLASL